MKTRILLLIAMIAIVEPSLAHAKEKLWVTTERLERRTCPDTKCGVVGQLFFREGVDVLEERGKWVRITNYYDGSCVEEKSEYVDTGNAECSADNGINDGQFAEWVLKKSLSKTQPSDPSIGDSEKYNLIKGSDDYQKHKEVFVKAASDLISNGQCNAGDFKESGGWVKSTSYGSQPVYFTYCGGMTISNRVYLNAGSGKVFK